MTAAALKPNLMNHLFATRPERPDSGTLSASLISVGLHAAIAAAAVWASTELRPAVSTSPPEVIQPPTIFIEPQAAAPATGVPRTPTALPAPRLTAPALPVPDPTLAEIPVAAAIVEPGFAPLGIGAPQPGVPVTAAAPGGGSTTNGEFQIVQVLPALLNGRDVQRALEAAYPPMLRDAGIGGRVHLWLYIDETGRVVRADLKETSGQRALDQVALRVAPMMRFSPAMNRDQPVKVMVHVPLDFRATSPGR